LKPLQEENIKLIFGLKLRQLRAEQGLSLAELAQKIGMSVSYINEIEKGKKYPKTDKIMAIARALEVSYDSLVSLKLTKNLAPVEELLNSDILNELPLDLFGLEPRKLVEFISNAPAKLNAFISTLVEVARNYDMRQEHFFFAALRSYQELHDNYFPELEDAVSRFTRQFGIDPEPPVDVQQLQQILEETYHYEVDTHQLAQYPDLASLRSVFHPGPPRRLLINPALTPSQRAFLLGKELAFNYLGLEERPYTSTYIRVKSFEQVLNNFKASYFSVALLMNQELVVEDMKGLFEQENWDGEALLSIMNRYDASPEMFFHRLTNILPQAFGLNRLFFLRFNNERSSEDYFLTKELHLSELHNPHGNAIHEHYCRRWITLTILHELERRQQQTGALAEPVAGAQYSQYVHSDNEYLCFSIARPNTPAPNENVSVTIGLLVSEELKQQIRFWQDPAIPVRQVSATCERCPLTDCEVRAAPPAVLREQARMDQKEAALSNLFKNLGEREPVQ
jgi:transcriptional regulator with XRE-family HTH domain